MDTAKCNLCHVGKGVADLQSMELETEQYTNNLTYTVHDNSCSTEPIFIRKITGQKKGQISIHRDKTVQIIFITKGKLQCLINETMFGLVKGNLFILAPNVLHQRMVDTESGFEAIEINFIKDFVINPNSKYDNGYPAYESTYFESLLQPEFDTQKRISLTGKKQILAEEIVMGLYEEYLQKENGYLLEMKADIIKILVLLKRQSYITKEVAAQDAMFDYQKEAIIRSLQYIQTHFSEPISLEDAAQNAMISQSYYSHLFKIATKKTFIEYINFLRIEKAMDMLKNLNCQVVDICFDCGYKNINHFNRTFKKLVGISPTEFRKSQKENDTGIALCDAIPILIESRQNKKALCMAKTWPNL